MFLDTEFIHSELDMCRAVFFLTDHMDVLWNKGVAKLISTDFKGKRLRIKTYQYVLQVVKYLLVIFNLVLSYSVNYCRDRYDSLELPHDI